MPTFTVVAITPKPLHIQEFYRAAVNALKDEGRVHRMTLSRTVRSWRHEKPTFTTNLEPYQRGLSALTYPAHSSFGVRKWRWLEKGTKVRWAIMSRDWRSKTRIRYLGSGPGAGHVVLRGGAARRILMLQHRRPKIEARMWRDTLIRSRQYIFPRNVQRAFAQAARRAF